MSEWQVKKLGDIVNVINGYAFKSYDFTSLPDSNTLPVLKIKNVANGDVNLRDVQFHLFEKKLERYISLQGDILVALTGNHPQAVTQVVGSVSMQKFTKPALINQRVAKVDVLTDFAAKKYIFYFLRDKATHNFLASQSSGSANQANISKKDIENIELPLPNIQEQKAIASVLSSLDDKIDLLHRQNKTLESMAETLFRQWFVEEAQEDWVQVPLSSIAIFTNGLACQKYPPKPGLNSLPVLKIKELNTGITPDSALVSSDIDPKYIVEHGDIIFAWSASLMVEIWSGPQCVLNQHLFNVKSIEYPKWFYYAWCRYHLRQFISISESHATTMGHIKRKDLDEAIVLIPSDSKLEEMTNIMAPLLDMQIEKMNQINQLKSLRDTLLPKLISGEVRVKYEESQD